MKSEGNKLTGKQILALGIYVVGAMCVIIFSLKALLGGNHVSYPDAMIPHTDFEINAIILGIGFLPMFAASLFMIHVFQIKQRVKQILILIPGIITVVPFLLGVGLILIMLVMGFFEAYSGMTNIVFGQ